MSVPSSQPIGVWKLELDGRTYSIELADWSESTGLPGAVTSDGASYSLGHWLGGLPQMVSFQVGGHPAALQWAYRAHLVGVPVPFLSDTVAATTADWWTYELAVDGTSEGSWVLHKNWWTFVPPGGELPTSGPSTAASRQRPIQPSPATMRSTARFELVAFLLIVVVVIILVVGFSAWLYTAIQNK